MNVLNKITYLRTQKGWSEYQLSEYSGLTQSTISSWYRKNMSPSIASLEKICNAFGITLSQFFLDGSNSCIPVNKMQQELLDTVSKLNKEQTLKLIEFIKCL